MKKPILIAGLVIFWSIQSIYCVDIAFTGLTKTLAKLISARPKTYLSIGSNKISLDSLIDDDIASNFDCDAAINKYINGDDDAYYEKLASIMGEEIKRGFGDDGSTFVIVDASEENYIMRISLYVSRERRVSIPIVIETTDSRFKASCSADCVAKFKFSADLLMDSNLVNNDNLLKGISLQMNTFSIELSSGNSDSDEEPNEDRSAKTTYTYNKAAYEPIQANIDLFASLNWYLWGPNSDLEEDDKDFNSLSYEQLSRGQFEWRSFDDSRIGFSSTALDMNGETQPAADAVEFNYSAVDLFGDARQEEIYIFDDEWIKLETPSII